MNSWTAILKDKSQEFVDGLKYGINEFAVWKDGRELVGCGILTKRAVFAEIDAAWDIILTHRAGPEDSGQ